MDNQNNIWIDRAEYERLKALEQEQASGVVTPTHAADGTAAPYTMQPIAPVLAKEEVPSPSQAHPSLLTILTALFAVFSFIFPPALIIFLILGIMSIIKYFTSGKSTKKKTGVGIAVGIIGLVLLVVASPILLVIGSVVLWQIGCWTGLGSCTTA